MTSREKFESWWVKSNDGCQPRYGWEKLRTHDGYNDEFIDFQYEGFKAAEEVFQQQLNESKREFRAADATIHNLELKLTDTAVQLANAESKCRELAAVVAENSAIKVMNDCLSEELRGYESDGAFEGPKMHLLWWKVETPATDAFLAEVRASARNDFIGRIEWIIRNECNPDKTEAIINELQNFSDELKLEAAQ